MLDEPMPEGDYAEILKNGVILCRLMNKINPTAIIKFKEKVCVCVYQCSLSHLFPVTSLPHACIAPCSTCSLVYIFFHKRAVGQYIYPCLFPTQVCSLSTFSLTIVVLYFFIPHLKSYFLATPDLYRG